jgi:hypothetical protein
MYVENSIILIIVNMAIWNGHRGNINKIKKFIPIVIQTKKQSSGSGKDKESHQQQLPLKKNSLYGEAIAEMIFPLHSVKFEMISQDCLSVRKFISSSAQSNGKSFPRW